MKITSISPMTRARFTEILDRMPQVQAGILGDLCLDGYWNVDMRKSSLSRETPFFPMPVTGERYSPGGAGNVACNLQALMQHSPAVLGVTGDDWRGSILRDVLKKQGISTEHIVSSASASTNTYIKPMRHGYGAYAVESERLDFVNSAVICGEDEESILESLKEMEKRLDVLCVSDQMEFGCITPRVREALIDMGRRGMRIIVDSRDRIGLYSHVLLKPNELEAARALDGSAPLQEGAGLDELSSIAAKLAEKTQSNVLLTMGGSGCMYVSGGEGRVCPAFRAEGPLDICGAGDTFMSALACAWAAGAQMDEAMQIANLASSITIRKIGVTGTATREELIEAWDAQQNEQ